MAKNTTEKVLKYSVVSRFLARPLWLMPVILATMEAEIRRIVVQSSSGEIVCETQS
jgi:hypothetical protein